MPLLKMLSGTQPYVHVHYADDYRVLGSFYDYGDHKGERYTLGVILKDGWCIAEMHNMEASCVVNISPGLGLQIHAMQ